MTPTAVAAGRPRRALTIAASIALAAAGVTTGLGLAHDDRAFGVGALLAALLASGGGAALIWSARVPATRRVTRVAFGLGSMLWGVGEGLIALGALADPLAPQRPTLGDAICTAAAPLALVAMLALPRPVGSTGRRLRLGLDALLIASAATAVLWQMSFRAVSSGSESTTLAVTVLLADLSVFALALLLAVSSLDRGLLVSALGLGLFVTGDLCLTHELVQAGGAWPWQAAAAASLAWPLICTGFLMDGSGEVGPSRLRRLGADVRSGAATAILVVGLAASLAVIAGLGGEPLDLVSALLLVLLVALLGTRELVHQRQRGRLVRDLTAQAEHDFLTGAGNRRALTTRLQELSASGAPASVVVLDLDGFKEVNDRLGHGVGDLLLIEVTRAVTAALPVGWRVFRLGGDEFALAGEGPEERACDLAHTALQAVQRAAAAVEGVGKVHLSAGAGVAQLPPAGDDPLGALTDASTAMQMAKGAGRGQVAVHAGELAARARHRALVTQRLRRALVHDELTVALQPVVDIATGAVSSFEALSRWEDGELGVVRPDEFIPLAEESGLVLPLGAAALHRGLAALVALGGVERRLGMAVNASPLELRSPSYVGAVRAALRGCGVPADLLTLEVTEAIFVTRDDPAVKTLQELADLGVRVSVDDFGTGYSSLSYLARLPVHAVKIDRSLVSGLDDPRTLAVVGALVGMCRALALDVVAEGVEEPAQAVALLELGVQHGQGWLWSRALPLEELRATPHGGVGVIAVEQGPTATTGVSAPAAAAGLAEDR